MLHTTSIVIPKNSEVNYRKILDVKSKTTYKRSMVEIKETGKNLVIRISANDLVALRASINSILRDIQVISVI